MIRNATLPLFVALASVGLGQMGGRTFDYVPAGSVSADYSAPGNPVLNFGSQVTVSAYLYVNGTFAGSWSVDGFGSGSSSQTQTVTIYHNETLYLDFESFGDATKVSGPNTGTTVLPVTASVGVYNNVTNALLNSFPTAPATDLNGYFGIGGPAFPALDSGGALRVELTQTVELDAGVGPGVYETSGTVTIVRT
ncbi:MAG: hypothetical protein KIS66_13390 [Fimbriimonadaceae bacterium]|nr:hypothetical protein [Fimbriimonadaceae bacterium]